MSHQEGQIVGQAELTIHWQAWLPASAPRGAVVIAHGLGEHGGRYRRLAEQLVGDGLAVYAIDHRGHGRSEGRRAKLDRFRYAVQDLDQLVELTRDRSGRLPVFLLGHSMGGAIAVGYALKHQDKLQGLILSGPAISVEGAPWLVRVLSQLLTNVLPNLPLFAIDPSLVSRDPEEVRAYAEDPLNMHGKVPLRTVAELFRAAGWLSRALTELKLPLLVVHGTADKLVPARVADLIDKRSGSSDKTIRLYEGFYHELLNEPPADRQRVMDQIADWVVSRA